MLDQCTDDITCALLTNIPLNVYERRKELHSRCHELGTRNIVKFDVFYCSLKSLKAEGSVSEPN